MIEVILPVLNEAEALPWVLSRMPAGFEPLVVDNGSTDDSGHIAGRLGARVVTEPRRGFGAACFAGLSASRSGLVCFMDCDGSLDPRNLPRVCTLIQRGPEQLVLAARVPEPGAWPWHARLANRLLTLELRRRTGLRLTDLGPMRAASREGLIGLGICDRRFGWPLEMVIRAVHAGWDVRECHVNYMPRTGTSKISSSIGGSLRAASDMARVMRWSTP